jgi:hypothetical protein
MMSEEERWYPKYEKISIIVFTENLKEKLKYFNLFYFILGDKLEKAINSQDRKELMTDKLHIKFLTKAMNARGHKAHYVLNLTQDQEFNNCVAAPITIIHDYLKFDEKWEELFRGLDKFNK